MENKIHIFISWSGVRSKLAAEAFHDFFELFFRDFRPRIYLSSGTEKGIEWYENMVGALKTADFGFLLLTEENCAEVSPWMMYEAGVLSETAGKSHVMTFLLNTSSDNIPGPLRRIQSTAFDRKEITSLVVRMYRLYKEKYHLPSEGKYDSDEVLRAYAEAFYVELERILKTAATMKVPDSPTEQARKREERLLQLAEENQNILRIILANQTQNRIPL